MNILTEEVAIEGRNIIKDFQLGDTKTRVLKNISLKVIQGEFVSIMGQSGSGKSTLLYILGGLGRLIGQTGAYPTRIVRGTTATCGNRPRTNWKSRNPVCRRTDGKPR